MLSNENMQGWAKWVYSCEQAKHRVDSCIMYVCMYCGIIIIIIINLLFPTPECCY